MEARFEHDESFLVVDGQRFRLKTSKKTKLLITRLARRGRISDQEAKRLNKEMKLRFQKMVAAMRSACGLPTDI